MPHAFAVFQEIGKRQKKRKLYRVCGCMPWSRINISHHEHTDTSLIYSLSFALDNISSNDRCFHVCRNVECLYSDYQHYHQQWPYENVKHNVLTDIFADFVLCAVRLMEIHSMYRTARTVGIQLVAVLSVRSRRLYDGGEPIIVQENVRYSSSKRAMPQYIRSLVTSRRHIFHMDIL